MWSEPAPFLADLEADGATTVALQALIFCFDSLEKLAYRAPLEAREEHELRQAA